MQWAKKQKGFTIVELLIVVVVIAILAAITIISYNGITKRANESAAASMASQAQKKLAAYSVINNGQYPATLAEAEINDSLAASLQYSVNNTTSPAGFCVTATKSGVSSYAASSYQYVKSDVETVNQAAPSAGVCPGHATNNGSTITNLIINPALRSVSGGWTAISSVSGAPSGSRVGSVTGLAGLGITTAYRNTLGGVPVNWWRVQYDANVSVVEGSVYTLSGYVRPSVTASTGVIIIWRNASGATIIESVGTFSTQAASSWAQKSVTATAPAGAVTARLNFGASGNGAVGAYFDTTAAMLYEGSSVYSYSDGNSDNWIWEGVVDASRSKGPTS